ncbi:MAG: glycine C-acetyltransferase [Spirochaetia bacterium]|jgi:glycine C-acetyltransferase|nr:glycine C-acetyltransferase [Spirochaetia bacterium]
MNNDFSDHLNRKLDEIKEMNLYKNERVLTTPQGSHIETEDGKKVLNFCSNNYIGFANNNDIKKAAVQGVEKWGFGLSSVRFICGTQSVHKQLEKDIASFTGCEDAILYAACFDANGGVFEPLFDENDAIISDELNHASIIDGIRLSKAKRVRYKHMDMEDLEKQLVEAKDSRFRIICTDGVFSMDGDIAPVDKIVELAEKYNALVMVDDSHATGYIGKTGRGSAEHCGVLGRVDIITTTFGKALGGASGGCICARKEIVEMLRQKSRPYLFSNTLAPAVAAASIEALSLLKKSNGNYSSDLKKKSDYFRGTMKGFGFDVPDGDTAIIPVMLYDEHLAVNIAENLYVNGIYVIPFSFPVVPKGKARIRVQISTEHSMEDINRLLEEFKNASQST